jgi:hypothetical protein
LEEAFVFLVEIGFPEPMFGAMGLDIEHHFIFSDQEDHFGLLARM